jgi:hypothetical protein
MTDPLAIIARNKLLCTGVGLDYDTPPDLTPQRQSEADFDALVTEYHKLFRESLRDDVAFLRSVEDHAHIAYFDDAVYLLRTAKQHQDNAKATAYYSNWTTTHKPWQLAAEALANACSNGLTQLDRISGRVRRDSSLARAWKDRASIEPETIFEAVCLDLAARFTVPNKRRMVGNVAARLRLHGPGTDTRTTVENLCAREITSQALTLPVPYYEVLDRLGLMGRREARAALLLAYSVASSTALRGEAFMTRVDETWKLTSS